MIGRGARHNGQRMGSAPTPSTRNTHGPPTPPPPDRHLNHSGPGWHEPARRARELPGTGAARPVMEIQRDAMRRRLLYGARARCTQAVGNPGCCRKRAESIAVWPIRQPGRRIWPAWHQRAQVAPESYGDCHRGPLWGRRQGAWPAGLRQAVCVRRCDAGQFNVASTHYAGKGRTQNGCT